MSLHVLESPVAQTVAPPSILARLEPARTLDLRAVFSKVVWLANAPGNTAKFEEKVKVERPLSSTSARLRPPGTGPR